MNPPPPTLQELVTYQCWVDHSDYMNARNIADLVKWARWAVENPTLAVVHEVKEIIERKVVVEEVQTVVALLHTQDEKDAYELGRLEGLKQAEQVYFRTKLGDADSFAEEVYELGRSPHMPTPMRLDRLRIVLTELAKAANRLPRGKDQYWDTFVDRLTQARRCLEDEGIALTDGWEVDQ